MPHRAFGERKAGAICPVTRVISENPGADISVRKSMRTLRETHGAPSITRGTTRKEFQGSEDTMSGETGKPRLSKVFHMPGSISSLPM